MRRPSYPFTHLPFLLLAGLMISVLALTADAQDDRSGEQRGSGSPGDSTITIGLALSGGGAKGFAHIGVLKVLQETGIPVHVVTGSSMGAMVGGLYAAGYEPARIEEMALGLDWQALFDDRYKRRTGDLGTYVSSRETWLLSFPLERYRPQLPSGLIDGQNLSMLLYRWTLPWHGTRDFTRLPVPFAAVATDLATGKPHTLATGYLPEAIRASAAIPTIFKPVSYGGRLDIDGSVSRNIPAEEARRMGADMLLVSDVGEPVKPVDSLRTFVDILVQSVGFRQAESDSAQLALADLRIRPDIEGFDSFSYLRTGELIRLGEEAARRMLPQIRELLEGRSPAPAPGQTIPEPDIRDSLRITRLRLERYRPQACPAGGICPPPASPRSWPTTILKARSTVSTRRTSSAWSPIACSLIPPRRAATCWNSPCSRTNLTAPSSACVMTVPTRPPCCSERACATAWPGATSFRLNCAWGRYSAWPPATTCPLSCSPLCRFHTDLKVYRSPIDLYGGGERLSTVEVEAAHPSPSLSLRLAQSWRMQAGVQAEFYNLNEAVGNILLLEGSRFQLNSIIKIGLNSLDRTNFPGRGHQAVLALEGGSRSLGSENSFLQLLGNWRAALPLWRGLTLHARLAAGHTLGGSPPLHDLFYPGGMSTNPRFPLRQVPLHGYANQRFGGRQMLAAGGSLQWEVGRELFLEAGWNAARVSAEWDWSLKSGDFRHGWFLEFGAHTLLGPASVVLSSPDLQGGYALALSVGYTF
ncbi:MAG: patatin-like phospholipase family protein [Balneolaceae bacterium]|nr:patatin-like phospholipase family protein [Balneolaceae bacterium]